MKEKVCRKKPYVRMKIEVINLEDYTQLLTVSPLVQPGGGGGGRITVEPPVDDDDEELFGAKYFSILEKIDIPENEN